MHPGGFYVSPGFLILYGGESATGERRGVRGNLTTTETRFGGVRYWWECPGCWRRCRVLYAYPVCGRERFACRRCQQLGYYSHNEGPADRLLRRARKCWRRAGSTDGSEPWRKPRWMRWDTFSRLVLEGRKASEAADWMMLASPFRRNSVPPIVREVVTVLTRPATRARGLAVPRVAEERLLYPDRREPSKT